MKDDEVAWFLLAVVCACVCAACALTLVPRCWTWTVPTEVDDIVAALNEGGDVDLVYDRGTTPPTPVNWQDANSSVA